MKIKVLIMRYYIELKENYARNVLISILEIYLSLLFLLVWIGTISFLVTPVYIVNNVYRYVATKIRK